MVSGELTPDRANHDYHGPEGTDCYMSAPFNRQEAESRSICTNEGCRASSEYVLVIRSLRWREDRVEFGLLGPLLVRVDSTPVRVSAGKQRVLLATMLVRANQVVAVDDLARAVWDGSPPESARVTLQNYVKRLRQALGPTGYQRIATCPAGYLIEAAAEELDLTRFGQLRDAGRAAARAGAWTAASDQLSAALLLWRGPPLADVPSRLLTETEVPRLAEMRLDALEARIDADLHLGRHREVIAELQPLVSAQPPRER